MSDSNEMDDRAVEIRLLGAFAVTVAGHRVPDEAWSRRGPAGLVKVLALADARALHRERILHALWPGVPTEIALPRLHKAAHFARRALGEGSIALRRDQVLLFPGMDLRVDAVEFGRLAEQAVAEGSVPAAETALAAYAGPLLPEDLYEDWAAQPRDALGLLHRDLLRLTERWADLVREDPTDETAHLSLARQQAARGDARGALRQLERLEQALRRELGTVPSAEVVRLREELAGAAAPSPPPVASPATAGAFGTEGRRLVGRRDAADAVRTHLDRAAGGRGATLLVTGPAGIGKSAVLDLATSLARRRGWRTARGAAAAVEGAWPYAPVLEAFADLCRQHPTLLDGLDDGLRRELDRALSGDQASWTGETVPQRLFVAAAELLRLAASDHGLLLVVDDVHEADEASRRLLHYLARCAVTEPVLIALAARPDESLREVEGSLLARGAGTVLDLSPLDRAATRRLIAHHHPEIDDDTAAEIWEVSRGLPYRILEAAHEARGGAAGVAVSGLPPPALQALSRVALAGSAFTTDELIAVTDGDEEEAYAALGAGLATAVVVPADAGYRFRHTLVREALLATFAPHERPRAAAEVAERLARLGAPAIRVAHLFVAAGRPGQAVPFARQAVETAGALGAYRDGLALIDAVIDHATGSDRARLLTRRGDLLLALGDPGAAAAYRAALSVTDGTEHRLVRARLARVAVFQGDFETAGAALAGLEVEGDAADGPLLLARGNLAYFRGDVPTALAAADAAREMLRPDDIPQIADLVTLQGMIAHQRGEWFDRFRLELQRTRNDPGLANTIFDSHLCVAEFMLYGPVPYAEVIALTEQLRRRSERDGALRGIAFATALIGEAALLMGDLDRAERELREAADLHRELDASAGEALSLQRLAEVRLARGDRDGADELLRRALRLARWSVVSSHLLQRIFGGLVNAAADPAAAMAVVEQAEAAMGAGDSCFLCDVMFDVPAAIACARVGDLDGARRHLAAAEVSGERWPGSAWQAALAEARGHLRAAEGDAPGCRRELDLAAQLFSRAGQPLDAARCAAVEVPAPRPADTDLAEPHGGPLGIA